MNRREAITGVLGATISTPVVAQIGAAHLETGTSNTSYLTFPEIPLDERKRQYAICKERGHSGNMLPFTNAVWPPGPTQYRCKFCGTIFWTETTVTVKEVDAP